MLIFMIETIVVVGALVLGIRGGGVATGFWSGAGAAVLVLVFRVDVDTIPIAVLMIALSVMAAGSALDAAGGLRFITKAAARLLRRHPNYLNIMAPLVVFLIVMFAGTAFVVVALIPVIAAIAIEHGIRPSRPLGGALAAASVAIVASPVSAATAVSLGFLGELGTSLGRILVVTIPAGLIGTLAMGVTLYAVSQRRPWSPPAISEEATKAREATSELLRDELPRGARTSVVVFAFGILVVVLCGSISQLRPMITVDGESTRMPLTTLLPLVMFAVGAVIMLLCRVRSQEVMDAPTFRAGFVAIIALVGVSTLAATYLAANTQYLVEPLTNLAHGGVLVLALVIALLAAVMSSQAASLSAALPIALDAAIPGALIVGALPATGGNGFLPINGYEYVCVEMDTTKSTRVGNWILNHFAFIPALLATLIATGVGFAITAVLG